MDNLSDCDDLLHLLCPSPNRGAVDNLVIKGADSSGVKGSRSQPVLQPSNPTEHSSVQSSRSDSALLPPHNLELDELNCDLLESIMSPLDANLSYYDQSLITELLLGSTDSITVGGEVFPAASHQQGGNGPLPEVAALLPWGASSTDTDRCIPSGPACVAAAAAAVGGHQTGGSSAPATGTALGMGGDTTQPDCVVQGNEISLLLSKMKATCSRYPGSSRRPKGSEQVMCAAAEVGGRGGGGLSDLASVLPLPLQGEDKIALACKDKWKLCFNVGRKLIMEEAVPCSYRSKGCVPIARSLFGAPLDGHSVPFVLGTEFPDPNYSTARPTEFHKNMLVCGKLNLSQNRVTPLYDYNVSSMDTSVNLASTNIRVHALRLVTIPLVEHVRDMCWLHPHGGSHHTALYIAAVAGPTLSILRWDTERDSVQVVADSCQVQNDVIRTVAGRNDLIAVGGFEGDVTVHNITSLTGEVGNGQKTSSGSSLVRYSLHGSGKGGGEDVVSCLQWRDEHTLGCTSDGGRMLLFDVRAPFTPTLDLTTGREGLFCHAFLNTDQVSFVLGFDGGIIERMDMRMQVQPVLRFKDASVSAVSDIHLSSDDSHMLVVGARGFSFYERTHGIQKHMGNLALRSHLRHNGPDYHDMQYIFSGGFIPGTTTYALADSQGWLAADDWLRGTSLPTQRNRTNCGKVKVVRGRRGCASTRKK